MGDEIVNTHGRTCSPFSPCSWQCHPATTLHHHGTKFYYVLIYPAPLAAVRGFVPHVVWHRDFDAEALLPMNARMMNIEERYLALQSIPKILELAGSMSR